MGSSRIDVTKGRPDRYNIQQKDVICIDDPYEPTASWAAGMLPLLARVLCPLSRSESVLYNTRIARQAVVYGDGGLGILRATSSCTIRYV